MRFNVIAVALAASLGMLAPARGAGPRFYPDDPIAVDHDRDRRHQGAQIDLDDYYDFKNTFAARAITEGTRST
jgi:hypothetical protein